MAQRNVQIQSEVAQLAQQQQMSAQHVLLMRLLELPLDALHQRIDDECLENPWLEKKDTDPDGEASSTASTQGEGAEMDYNPADDYRSEDDIPTYLLHQPTGSDTAMESIEYGETLSFYDHLKEQMGEYDLNERQRMLLDYLIGSLDEDGLLRKPLYQVADELAIYQAIDATEQELQDVLGILWQFDPAGIGARSLQECLRLQIERHTEYPMQKSMMEVVDNCWDEFMHKRWDLIAHRLRLTAGQSNALKREMTHLNPRPGSALSEVSGQNTQQITPDFYVEADAYGNLTMSLNKSGVPELTVSADATDKLREYAKLKDTSLSPSAMEELNFTRRYVERGQLFINALRQRHETMLRTMTIILHLQRPFFLEGDEALLRPMILDDVAKRANLDPSTVSRVCNSKYVQTNYGTFPLRWFFTQKAIQKGDEALSARQVMTVLKELIDGEDKQSPLTDEQLSKQMKEKGYDIARRTIAKYREQMGVPVARMRR